MKPASDYGSPQEHIDALRAENARLREALEPFARAWEASGMEPDWRICLISGGGKPPAVLDASHMTAARTALAKARGEG